MRIVGIDPGARHCGLAVLDSYGSNQLKLIDSTTLEFDQQGDLLVPLLRYLSAFEGYTHMVVENYHGGSGGTYHTDTCRLIGGVETYYYVRTRFVSLAANISSTVFTKQYNVARAPFLAKAKELVKARDPHYTQHQVDACAHALSVVPPDYRVS